MTLETSAGQGASLSPTHEPLVSVIYTSAPTVLEDFFDLSVRRNYIALSRFRAAAATAYSTKRSQAPETDSDGSSTGNQLLQYECLHDTWRSILSFRSKYFCV